MVKRKSEHHSGLLSDLEELSLHQLNIEKIESIGNLAPRLKILYLQNNLINRIENVRRLKNLEYFNLALNNLKLIENLESCEKLKKLDLTVNFIELPELEVSVNNLSNNQHLSELYLTGNPCTQWSHYRLFTIAIMGKKLEKLDGKEITRTERMEAEAKWNEIAADYKVQVENLLSVRGSGVLASHEDSDEKIACNEKIACYTPEIRRQQHLEELTREKAKEEEKQASMRSKPDEWELAHKKLNEKVELTKEQIDSGFKPSQRNTGRFVFKLIEKCESNTINQSQTNRSSMGISGELDACSALSDHIESYELHVELPRFLDTSLIDIDIHPLWLQIIVKSKNLLLHLDEEIHIEQSSIQRVTTTGELIVKMKKLKNSYKSIEKFQSGKMENKSGKEKNEKQLEEELDAQVDEEERNKLKNQTNNSNDSSGVLRPLSEIRYGIGPLESHQQQQQRERELRERLQSTTIKDEKAAEDDGPPPLEPMIRKR